jgi:hypothetical protein
MYKEDTLLLEIEATDENNQITFYKIPLELNEQCGELFSTES